jgi:hypothetical protein
MFKEMGVSSIGEDDLAKIDEAVFNTKVDEQRCSVTVGEALVIGLLAFDRKVPGNLINTVCSSGEEQMADLLKVNLEFWNKHDDNEAIRKIFKEITIRQVADMIVSKDAGTTEDALRKRLSLQSALVSFGVEFVRSF